MHLLSDADVIDLTGYTQLPKQIAWLQKNGVKFFLRGIDSKVRTTWHFVNNPEPADEDKNV